MSKLVRIQTEHTYEIKMLFDVLKEILNEVKIDFLKSDNETCSKSGINDESANIELLKKSNKKGKKTSKKPKRKSNQSEDSENSDNEEDTIEKSKESEKKASVGGIRIMALDEHQSLLIYVKLNPNQFLDYYVKPKCHTIGLDLVEFHKFIKTIDKDSIMNIYIDKDDEQNIVFELQNSSRCNSSKYKQKLMDIDDNSKQLPTESNFHMSVMMDTIDFKKICSEMSQFSDYVEITCTNKELTFKCRGDSNAFERTFQNSNSDEGVRILSLKKDGPPIFQAIYKLKHLVTFGRCTNLCTEMQLYLRNDYPLFIYFTIGSLGKLLVGLSPEDGKLTKKDVDYDESNDKYYNEKKINIKQ